MEEHCQENHINILTKAQFENDTIVNRGINSHSDYINIINQLKLENNTSVNKNKNYLDTSVNIFKEPMSGTDSINKNPVKHLEGEHTD